MTVQLEVGMTGVRRDGERVGPGRATSLQNLPFGFGLHIYRDNGSWGVGTNHHLDIIAAGYPWATLGAQVGDTVKRVWCGYSKLPDACVDDMQEFMAPHPDSLYVIVKTAAKPADPPAIEWGEWVDGPAKWSKRMVGRRMQVEHAGPNVRHRIAKEQPVDRPRAAHKLDLQDGDRVRLDAWQDGDALDVGRVYEKRGGRLVNVDDPGDFWNLPLTDIPKGNRPLFTVLPRAADAKPDEVIVVHTSSTSAFGRTRIGSDTHRLTIRFPHGSDTGTVTREKL